MLDHVQPPRRARRWFQFGLSTLLLATLLAAVLVAWQRERLSRWVESLLPAKAGQPAKDPRDPRQIVLDFIEFGSSGKPDEAEPLLSPVAREVVHWFVQRLGLPAPARFGVK